MLIVDNSATPGQALNDAAQKPSLRLALVQASPADASKSANLERAEELINQAGRLNVDLICFPEMYLSNYVAMLESRSLAEPIPGPASERLTAAAARHGINVIMGMPTLNPHRPGAVYNSAVLIGPAGVIGVHSKVSLPTFCVEELLVTEGNYWSPGMEIPVFEVMGWRIGVNICADCWVPEIPRIQALAGAECLITISAGPSMFADGWAHVLRARAVENAVYQAYANVVGTHRGTAFFGGCALIDPDGQAVVEGPRDEEALVIGRIDADRVFRSRAAYPRLRTGYDRQPYLYGRLVQP